MNIIDLLVLVASVIIVLLLVALVWNIIDRFRAPFRMIILMKSGKKFKANTKNASADRSSIEWSTPAKWKERLMHVDVDQIVAIKATDRRINLFCL